MSIDKIVAVVDGFLNANDVSNAVELEYGGSL